ncbi:hypothetical protein CWI39_0264p0010 [Hamiltosporidium magnivora]|uniref:Uncharacterized protein n=1 Tax=Hamiltosporidium magnivora TaxID=148818 RepID=A0A4Q9LI42_9MICR|nr:hypothetical protein CWI39_0264p0010 [Hamiltosporidium magnivora]
MKNILIYFCLHLHVLIFHSHYIYCEKVSKSKGHEISSGRKHEIKQPKKIQNSTLKNKDLEIKRFNVQNMFEKGFSMNNIIIEEKIPNNKKMTHITSNQTSLKNQYLDSKNNHNINKQLKQKSNVRLQFGEYFPLETKINLTSENSLSASYHPYREKVSDNVLNQNRKLHQKRSNVTAKNTKTNKDSKSNNETIKTSIEPNDKTFEDTRLNSFKSKISNREPIQQILEPISKDSKTRGDEKKYPIKNISESLKNEIIHENNNEKDLLITFPIHSNDKDISNNTHNTKPILSGNVQNEIVIPNYNKPPNDIITEEIKAEDQKIPIIQAENPNSFFTNNFTQNENITKQEISLKPSVTDILNEHGETTIDSKIEYIDKRTGMTIYHLIDSKIKLKDINESKGIVDSVHAQHISEDSNEKEKGEPTETIKNLQNLHEIQPSIAENENEILNKYFNWYKKNVNEDTQYNDILYVLHDPTQNEALMNHNIDINTIVDQNGNPIPDAKSKREILVNFLLYYKSFVNPNGQDHFNNIGHPHAKKRHDISKKTYAISDINKNFKEDVNQNIQKPINYSDLDSAETHSNEKYDKFVQIFQNQENTETLNSLNNNDFNENHDIFPPQYFSNTYPGATEDKIDFYPNTTESNMTKSKYPDNKSYMPGVHSNIYRFSNTDDKIYDSGIPYVFDRNNLESNVMFREEGADSHSNIGSEYKNPNVSYTNYFNILSGLDSNTTKNTNKAIKKFDIAHQKTHLGTPNMSESEYFTYGNPNIGVIKEQGENNDAGIVGNIESGNTLNRNPYYNSLYHDINSNTTKDSESTNLSNNAIFPVQNPSTDSRNFLQQKMNAVHRKSK